MNIPRSILLPIDFSSCSEHPKDYAFALARNVDCTLHIVHVVDDSYLYAGGMTYPAGGTIGRIGALSEQMKKKLDIVVEAAKNEGIETFGHLFVGIPHHEIVKSVDELGCGLIVIGTHGRSGISKLFFGSTCEKVVRHSKVPVLSVKQDGREFVEEGVLSDIDRVLCPVDFSDTSNEALELAAELGTRCNATLTLLHVINASLVGFDGFVYGEGAGSIVQAHEIVSELLEKWAKRYPEIKMELEVVTGTPHREIVHAVSSKDIDLTVMATHGRTGIAHALIGSTAEKVVRLARSPVLTVQPKSGVRSGVEHVEIDEKVGV